jgi:hypothetical protein
MCAGASLRTGYAGARLPLRRNRVNIHEWLPLACGAGRGVTLRIIPCHFLNSGNRASGQYAVILRNRNPMTEITITLTLILAEHSKSAKAKGIEPGTFLAIC